MKRNVLIGVVALVLNVFALLVLTSCDGGRSESPIAVGVLFPLTGDASAYGQKGRKAVEMAIDDFNAKQAAGGVRVTAIFEDSKGNAKDGVSAAQKLMTVNHVPAIVGDALSAVTLPVASVTEANHAVLISPCSSAPALTQAGPFTYRIWPSDLAEGKAAAEFAISKGFKNAALLHLNNDYGNGIADIFEKRFVGEGRKVVLKSAYQDTATDWRAILTPLISAGADVVYVAGYYKDTAAVLRTAAELGVKAQFIGATAIEDENLIKLAGAAAEGIVYPLATGFDVGSDDPTMKAFASDFKKRFGSDPGWMEAHAYDAFMLICVAAKSGGGKVSGAQIRDYLDHMGTYHGVTGDIKFDENGDVLRGVVYKTVKGGRFLRLSE